MPLVAPRFGLIAEALLLAVVFALAHTQSPLFYSNQNQYLLHGLAAGGLGHLQHDWLANTRDPTPVFTKLVAMGYRNFGPWTIQAAYFLVLMGYYLSAGWLVAAIPRLPATCSFRLAFAMCFTAAHAAVLRVASVEIAGTDYPWYLQSGVANQYLLGPGLQPSVFGTLLLTSLAAFAHGRTLLAGALAGLACTFHVTYILPAAMLTAGFVVVTVRRNGHGGPEAFKLLLAASAFAVPAAAYTLFTFGSPNPHTFAESQRILAEVRIPHHAEIERWFAAPDAAQLAWAVLGIILLRRTPLAIVLAIAAAGGTALTLTQYFSGSHMLALLFPWRISAVLVPVATAVILARTAACLPVSRLVAAGSAVILFVLATGGTYVMATGIGYGTDEAEAEMLEYVRVHAGPTDVYLLPVGIPAVGVGRGTQSTTFSAPPRPNLESNLIPVDLQRFRLVTGTPIFVDFKSVPYLDTEVLEWYRRIRRCESWYAGDWTSPGRAQELRDSRITHVVAPAARPIAAGYLEVVHSDESYIIYRVR